MGKTADGAPDDLEPRVRPYAECVEWPSIPHRLAKALQGEIRETQAISTMRSLLKGRGCLVVLSGQAGCGKSLAAAWACAVTRGAAYIHATELQGIDNAERYDKRLRWPGIVVIDDVGTEYNSEKRFAAQRIEAAIVEREAHEWPTVITTNLLPGVFRDRYGERIASRINGDGIGWVSLPAEDLRKRGNRYGGDE